VNALEPGAGVGDIEKEVGDEDIDGDGKEKKGAELPVTQSDDPRSGGHLLLGASKAPLLEMAQSNKAARDELVRLAERKRHTPGPPENVVE